jgi:glycosyltransferase involved in cell wall biosynthesis
VSATAGGPLRVLFFFPNLSGGGIARINLDLAIEMRRQGVDAGLLLMHGTGERLDEAREAGVPVHFAVPPSKPLGRWSTPRIARAFWVVARRYEVVVTDRVPAHAHAVLARPITRRPVIRQVHLDLRTDPAESRRTTRFLNRLTYPRTAAFVGVSEGAAESAVLAGAPPARTRLVYNGVNASRIRAMGEEHPCFSPRRRYVVGAGRLHDDKGFDVLIRAHALALARGVEHDLVLVGEGEDREKLATLAASLGVGGTVHMPGFLPNHWPVVARASVFCLPSRREGFALALLEALALGVPAIAADCQSGPRELFDDGRLGTLVPVEDVAALAAAIEEQLEGPDRFLERTRAAQVEVEQRFTIEAAARRYIELCLEAAGRT